MRLSGFLAHLVELGDELRDAGAADCRRCGRTVSVYQLVTEACRPPCTPLVAHVWMGGERWCVCGAQEAGR